MKGKIKERKKGKQNKKIGWKSRWQWLLEWKEQLASERSWWSARIQTVASKGQFELDDPQALWRVMNQRLLLRVCATISHDQSVCVCVSTRCLTGSGAPCTQRSRWVVVDGVRSLNSYIHLTVGWRTGRKEGRKVIFIFYFYFFFFWKVLNYCVSRKKYSRRRRVYIAEQKRIENV